MATTVFALPVLARDIIATDFSELEVRRYRRLETAWGEEPLRYRVAMRDAEGDAISVVVSPMGDVLRRASRLDEGDLPPAIAATASAQQSGDFLRAWRIETEEFVRYRVVFDNAGDDTRRSVIVEENGDLRRVRDWTPRC